MVICRSCGKPIDKGILYDNTESLESNSQTICLKCLKRMLDYEGKDIGLKVRIEKWLGEENTSFCIINEPSHLFHFLIKDFGPLKMIIEVFQEIDQTDLIIGFMTFLSNELSFKILKFDKQKKKEFKQKIDEFLASIRTDYRGGYRVGYELINEKGHFGAKYFVKSMASECTRNSFLKMVQQVRRTGEMADEFLNSELNR